VKKLALLIPLFLAGCGDPEYASITFASEHEGCRVYRIKDKDREDYFVKCTCDAPDPTPVVPAVKPGVRK
jgi:hypothetical protein